VTASVAAGSSTRQGREGGIGRGGLAGGTLRGTTGPARRRPGWRTGGSWSSRPVALRHHRPGRGVLRHPEPARAPREPSPQGPPEARHAKASFGSSERDGSPVGSSDWQPDPRSWQPLHLGAAGPGPGRDVAPGSRRQEAGMRHAGSPVCGASSLEAWVHREEWRANARRRSDALRCGAAKAGASESPEGAVETDGPPAALRRCQRAGTEPPRSKDWRVSAGRAAKHFGAPSPAGDASPWPEGPSAEPNFSDIARWREKVGARQTSSPRSTGERTRRRQLQRFGEGAAGAGQSETSPAGAAAPRVRARTLRCAGEGAEGPPRPRG
jgi:hypothetical protein